MLAPDLDLLPVSAVRDKLQRADLLTQWSSDVLCWAQRFVHADRTSQNRVSVLASICWHILHISLQNKPSGSALASRLVVPSEYQIDDAAPEMASVTFSVIKKPVKQYLQTCFWRTNWRRIEGPP